MKKRKVIPRLLCGVLYLALVCCVLPIAQALVVPTIDGNFAPPDEWDGGVKYEDIGQAGWFYLKQYYINSELYIGAIHDLTVDTTNNPEAWTDDYHSGDWNYFPIYDTPTEDNLLYEVYVIANNKSAWYPGKFLKHNASGTFDVTDDPYYNFSAKAGFGSSPNDATPHRIYEWHAKNISLWVKEYDVIVPWGSLIFYGGPYNLDISRGCCDAPDPEGCMSPVSETFCDSIWGTWYEGQKCCMSGPNAVCYAPETPEDGCCEYPGGCYDGIYDPAVCTECYGGIWHPGMHCEGGECIPEFTTIAIPVVAILGLLFLFSRRKRME